MLLGLLRRELGFDGVVITDALDMKAISATVGHGEGAVRSLAAGADLVCIGNPGYPEAYDADERLAVVVDAIVAAVEQRSARHRPTRGGRGPRLRPDRLAARASRSAEDVGRRRRCRARGHQPR